jgi:hypothetical protein
MRGRGGRFLDRAARVKALRRGLAKKLRTLERSMAHRPEPRPGDVRRWDTIRAEIALFEWTLAEVLAGREPPLAERTGKRTRELPDAV